MPRSSKVGVIELTEVVEFDADSCDYKDTRTRGGIAEVCVTILIWLSFIIIFAAFPITVWTCAKINQEYERAVIFRLGRVVKGQTKGPGLFWVIPWLDVIQKVDLRTISFIIPPQEVLTADMVPLKVSAVVFYHVVEPYRWVTQVEDGYQATHTLAQTTLRSTLGTNTLCDILTNRMVIAQRMKELLYAECAGWGVSVERLELKDVSLPSSLLQSMASEAEAVRKARAKMIVTGGEVQASRVLQRAASDLSPVALQLRYLQWLSSSVSDATSTIVFPFPRELVDSSS